MKLEKLKNNHKKKIIIGGVIVLGIATSLIILPSYSKYKATDSVKLGEGIINYQVPDINMVAMYIVENGIETPINKDPGSDYSIIEDKSYCKVNGVEDKNVIIKTIDGKLVLSNFQKGSKCYLYFSKNIDLILALNNYTFSWPAVEGAKEYRIYSDNELLTTTTNTQAEIWNNYTQEGTYEIKIAAVLGDKEVLSKNTIAYNLEKAEPKEATFKTVAPSSTPNVVIDLQADDGYINAIRLDLLHANNNTTSLNDLFALFKDNDNFCEENLEYCVKYQISTFEHRGYRYATKENCGYNAYYNSNTKQILMKYVEPACTVERNELGFSFTNEYNSYALQFIFPGTIKSSWLYGNTSTWCIDENALAYVYDRKKKRFKRKKLKDLGYDDEILVWDFDNGAFTTAKPLWIARSQTAYKYNLLKFSNGSTLKTLLPELGHRIFNKEKGEFTYPMTDDTPIGTTTFSASGEDVKLISKEIVEGKIRYTNIITEYHMNIFVNDILTSCRLNNIYPIKDMKFVKDKRKLKRKEDYLNIPERWFDGIRLSEQPEDINRGNARFWKDIEAYINDRENFKK